MNINRNLKVNTGNRARLLTDAYDVLTRRIQEQLRRLTPDTFSEGLAMEVRDKVEALTMQMSRVAVRWLQRAMPSIYREARQVAAKNASSVGYKATSPADHAGALARRQNHALAYLNDAAASVRTFTGQYIDAVRETVVALKNVPVRAEEFTFKKFVADTILETVKLKQSVWFAKSKIMNWMLEKVAGASFVNIGGRNYDIHYYVDLVARTELAKAYTDGTKNTLTEYGDDLVEFSDSAFSCDTCKGFGGHIYSMSGKSNQYPALPAEANIPVHPNCLLPGTRVESPCGFVAGVRAWYSGDAVEVIFSNGARVAVTINHMFLTPNGFASAHLLRKGDDVFYCTQPKGMISVDPNNNHDPSLVEDVVGALAETRGVSSSSVKTAPEYLHGDGRFIDGDIDVIGPDGFLTSALKTAPPQLVGTNMLNGADVVMPGFESLGDFTSVLKRLACAADGVVGGLRSPAPFFRARSGCSNQSILPECSKLHASISKSIADCFPGTSDNFGNIAHGDIGLIQLTHVVDIKLFPYFGHVFDLQTETTLYIANSILSSNCGCTLLPVSSFGGH